MQQLKGAASNGVESASELAMDRTLNAFKAFNGTHSDEIIFSDLRAAQGELRE